MRQSARRSRILGVELHYMLSPAYRNPAIDLYFVEQVSTLLQFAIGQTSKKATMECLYAADALCSFNIGAMNSNSYIARLWLGAFIAFFFSHSAMYGS